MLRSRNSGGRLVRSKPRQNTTPRTAPRKMKYGGRSFTGPSKGKLIQEKAITEPTHGCNWNCPDGAGGHYHMWCPSCPCTCTGEKPIKTYTN